MNNSFNFGLAIKSSIHLPKNPPQPNPNPKTNPYLLFPNSSSKQSTARFKLDHAINPDIIRCAYPI